VAQLIVLMPIIVDNKLQMSYLMCSGNAYMWHDCMCQQYSLVAM
jgi:hypothetical protein